jgi:ParB-like chromosome segregation protein Spo0J
MRVRMVPLAKITPYPGNPRLNDDAVDAVAASIKEFGFRQPIVVDAKYVIICGHTRHKAAIKLGLDKVPIHVAEDLTPEQVRAYRLADNGTAELAGWDYALLAGEVEEARKADLDPEIDQLLAGLVEESKKGIGEDESELFEKHFSVLVKCTNEPDQRAVLKEISRHGLDAKALVVDYPAPEKIKPTAGPELADGEIEIVRSVEIERTARVMQLEGLFDVPPSERREERWRVQIQLDRPWSVGLIIGPSGSGKTTLARELFGKNLVDAWKWSPKRAVIDDFPAALSIAEITAILSSVGFSSPPSWLKPFGVLSNGEQFRVNLARTLAEQPALAVVDEFTSVVDRTVAKIGSAALAKSVRASGRKFVAVSCHYDIEKWLQPDWKIEMPSAELTWRLLRRRPQISLHVRRVDGREWWRIFGRHHYLSHDLHRAAQCFLGTVEDRPAAFTAVLHNPHRTGGWWREHRTVCHPDFQGVGIGNAMSELIAGVFASTGKPYRSTTSHPAMIRHRLRSPAWRCVRPPSMSSPRAGSGHAVNRSRAAFRYTGGFEYVGRVLFDEAARLGLSCD